MKDTAGRSEGREGVVAGWRGVAGGGVFSGRFVFVNTHVGVATLGGTVHDTCTHP